MILERPSGQQGDRLVVACPITPRIANFDDLDPLKLEPAVDLVMVPPGRPIPDAALIVLAGSKATCADLAALRTEGWDIDILAHHRRGRPVLGLCGGYQMLGRHVADPNGLEGSPGTVAGLGLLDVETILGGDKTLTEVSGEALGAPFAGYEIHLGRTTGPDTSRPVGRFADGRPEGAISANGLVAGSYVHGLLSRPEQRAAWLARIGVAATGPDHRVDIDAALDEIAVMLEDAIDLNAILAIAQAAA